MGWGYPHPNHSTKRLGGVSSKRAESAYTERGSNWQTLLANIAGKMQIGSVQAVQKITPQTHTHTHIYATELAYISRRGVLRCGSAKPFHLKIGRNDELKLDGSCCRNRNLPPPHFALSLYRWMKLCFRPCLCVPSFSPPLPVPQIARCIDRCGRVRQPSGVIRLIRPYGFWPGCCQAQICVHAYALCVCVYTLSCRDTGLPSRDALLLSIALAFFPRTTTKKKKVPVADSGKLR